MKWGMTINVTKSKTTCIGVEADALYPPVKLKGNTLEAVEAFSYLGSEIGQTAC